MIHKISFKHAWDGVVYAFSSQPNMRFHGIFALGVVLAGYAFSLSKTEWLITFFMILLMFTAEMVNTAIESMTDLISKEYSKQAKIAKDVAAGMVLLNAVCSVIVGLVVFGPKVALLLNNV